MQIISAAQFVDSLMAALCLQGKTKLNLDDPAVDRQFAKAYEELLDQAEQLGLVPDFVIAADPTYGDSTCLRDAILDIRDSRSVALNNPRFVRLTMKFGDENTPDRVLSEGAVPRKLIERLAKQHLAEVAS